MQRVGRERGLDVLPAGVVEDRLLLDGDVDEGRALLDYLSGAEGVVTDLQREERRRVRKHIAEKAHVGESPSSRNAPKRGSNTRVRGQSW